MTTITEPTLHITRLNDRATVPEYKSDLAAGLDLAACLDADDEEITILPIWKGGRIEMIHTGLTMAIPPGFEGQVRPRSGLAARHGLTLPNAPGTIDADYRGELMVPLINLGPEAVTVRHGLRVAKLVIAPVSRAAIDEVSSLKGTDRGLGGFGSTGLR